MTFENMSFKDAVNKVANLTGTNIGKLSQCSALKFYKDVFVKNDYSFNSVCSSQRKDSEKEIISKGMDIFAKLAKVNNKNNQ